MTKKTERRTNKTASERAIDFFDTHCQTLPEPEEFTDALEQELQTALEDGAAVERQKILDEIYKLGVGGGSADPLAVKIVEMIRGRSLRGI